MQMPRSTRKSHSPSRPRHSALSPLQAFSPLHDDEKPLRSPGGAAPSAGGGGHRRTSSGSSAHGLRRSLSGRERVFERRDSNTSDSGGAITTRLILVKAPSDSKNDGTLRQRSKSSSSLAPISSMAASFTPSATSAGPRRSFAAASFSSFSPITAISPNNPFTRSPVAMHNPPFPMTPSSPTQATDERTKPLSPEEVLELARGLMSPVAAPEPSSARKVTRRKSSDSLSQQAKEPIALEPVDYVEMDDNQLLPFADRPREVARLLANPANELLFTQLKHAFPHGPMRPGWKDIDVEKWTWVEFETHLTTIDRRECSDYSWVVLARGAVREHSVALWEKLGTCLGCDPELMMAGDEDDEPASWGGLGLGDEGEYDPSQSRVFVESLDAVDPDEMAKAEAQLMLEFGSPVDDDFADFSVLNNSVASMETIGEETPPSNPHRHQEEGNSFFSSTAGRPRSSSQASAGSVLSEDSSIGSPGSPGRPKRTKSTVGLQILTTSQGPISSSPQSSRTPSRSPSMTFGGSPYRTAEQLEREPGNPLFPSSFNTLSLAPNLGRKASVTATYGAPTPTDAFSSFRGRGFPRKTSGTGLSESAITFVSDSSLEHI